MKYELNIIDLLLIYDLLFKLILNYKNEQFKNYITPIK